MDLFDRLLAAELRDAGIEQAVIHADEVEPRWSDLAYGELLAFMAGVSGPFMAEGVRRASKLPEPPDPRAWGGVLQRARRAGLLVKAGYAESRNPHAHLRPTALWEVADEEREAA